MIRPRPQYDDPAALQLRLLEVEIAQKPTASFSA